MIAGIAALSLILLVMMFITRSIVAALVIVGTVALSLGASFGLSVLIWQDIFGIELYWIVLALARHPAAGGRVGLQPAAGLPVQGGDRRRLEHRHHPGDGGFRRGGRRRPGLVFAATMASFVFADLRILGQIGTTIALGLLFDTLIVRSFMTPAIASAARALVLVAAADRPRPASHMLQPYGSRASVRQLLLWEDGDPVAGSPRHSGSRLNRRLGDRNFLQVPLQPRHPAQLRGHVHRRQHRDSADEAFGTTDVRRPGAA